MDEYLETRGNAERIEQDLERAIDMLNDAKNKLQNAENKGLTNNDLLESK